MGSGRPANDCAMMGWGLWGWMVLGKQAISRPRGAHKARLADGSRDFTEAIKELIIGKRISAMNAPIGRPRCLTATRSRNTKPSRAFQSSAASGKSERRAVRAGRPMNRPMRAITVPWRVRKATAENPRRESESRPVTKNGDRPAPRSPASTWDRINERVAMSSTSWFASLRSRTSEWARAARFDSRLR